MPKLPRRSLGCFLADQWFNLRLSLGFFILPGQSKEVTLHDGYMTVRQWSDDFDSFEAGE